MSTTLPDRGVFAEVSVGENTIALLKDGAQVYPAMLRAIASARSTICLETYIFRDDTTGRRFIEALKERARAGVETLVMYDDWGSSLAASTVVEMRDAGIRVVAFRPFQWAGSLGRVFAHLSRRNHRKSLIIDGAIAFAGGLNISNEYAAVADGGDGWRDTHVRLCGPVATELESLFLKTWNRNRGVAHYQSHRFERARANHDSRISILSNDFASSRKDIRRAYIAAISKAQHSVLLTNAYFLPPAKIMKVLTAAARRGVRVGIILGAKTDVKLVLWAARGTYRRMLKAGIELYEFNERILHAKTGVIDGAWVTVGSSNLDALSLRKNLEVNAFIHDPALGAAMERLFAEDIAVSERMTLESVRRFGFWQRLASWVASHFRQWL